jgi:hypothetical protein
MGTKRTSSEGAVSKAAKLPPKRKVVVRPAAVESAMKPKARKTSETPSPVASPATVATPGIPAGTQLAPEVIALRAYFICEQRKAEGRDGDSLSDWLEAERQLLSENQA